MKKLLGKSLLALFICGFISCSNEQGEIVSQKQSDEKSVEVVICTSIFIILTT